MKVLTSKGEHSVYWKYEQCNKQVIRSGGMETVKQDCTSCIIKDIATEEVISEVKVTRYFKDQQNRVLARKTTFEMALKGAEFSKADRRAFWDEFAKNSKLTPNDSRFKKKVKDESESAQIV